jgi:hypothetical protein
MLSESPRGEEPRRLANQNRHTADAIDLSLGFFYVIIWVIIIGMVGL